MSYVSDDTNLSYREYSDDGESGCGRMRRPIISTALSAPALFALARPLLFSHNVCLAHANLSRGADRAGTARMEAHRPVVGCTIEAATSQVPTAMATAIARPWRRRSLQQKRRRWARSARR